MEPANSSPATRAHNIRAVIVDFGEVLCLRAPREEFAPMARILRLTPQRFLERYAQNRLDYDRGDLTSEEYWKRFALETGITLNRTEVAELERGDLALWSRMDSVLLDWIQRLRGAGIRIGLISNMFIALACELRRSAEWLKSFDAVTFSSEIRFTKPHPEIYMHSLRHLGVPAADALFLDDLPENVKGAIALGMQGLLYINAKRLAQDLAARGFPILPASEDSTAPSVPANSDRQTTAGRTKLS